VAHLSDVARIAVAVQKRELRLRIERRARKWADEDARQLVAARRPRGERVDPVAFEHLQRRAQEAVRRLRLIFVARRLWIADGVRRRRWH